jgi:hypothetical protein
VQIKIPVSELKKWDINLNSWKLYSGMYKIVLGSNAKDAKVEIPFEIN